MPVSFDAKKYYEVLGLSHDAGEEEVKQSYRNLAKVWHPDQSDSEEALEKFQKISVAYDILKDEKKRLVYDLLSQVYTGKNFPEMFSLKPLKNMEGEEDVYVRGLRQKRVVSQIFNFTVDDKLEVCSYREAQRLVVKTSVLNWLLGWWSIRGFMKNVGAIVDNITKLDKNEEDNLLVLVHNSLAYWQEKKKDKALLSIKQAKIYADFRQGVLLDKLAELVGGEAKVKSPWNFGFLKFLQLIIPGLLILFFIIPLVTKPSIIGRSYSLGSKEKAIDYYQEVKFSKTGGKILDDVVVAKVFDIPVDIYDEKLLYHVKNEVKVMHAPGDGFDVLKIIDTDTTVRITGYTPDKIWYRIMLDGGEMGFVKRYDLAKGIGKQIPKSSKIYKQLNL